MLSGFNKNIFSLGIRLQGSISSSNNVPSSSTSSKSKDLGLIRHTRLIVCIVVRTRIYLQTADGRQELALSVV